MEETVAIPSEARLFEQKNADEGNLRKNRVKILKLLFSMVNAGITTITGARLKYEQLDAAVNLLAKPLMLCDWITSFV